MTKIKSSSARITICKQHELLDIINEEDEVISQATRRELYEKGLICRIVHVFVQ